MKLISFYRGVHLRAGAAINGYAVDLERAAHSLGSGKIPESMRAILEGGPPVMGRVRKTIRRVESKIKRIAQKKERRPVWIHPIGTVTLAPPVPNPEKIICIGQNYTDHCLEQGVDPPKTPIFFTKFPTTLTGPTSTVHLPPKNVTTKVDFEVEMAFVIGREAKRVKRKDAMDYVAGYMVLNDVSARDAQFGDQQWCRGKSFDSFAPCGPWVVTTDEIPDPHKLRLTLKVNGETMQDSSTKNLIFKIPFLIEYISKAITLRPGDVISTGTPPGVGVFRDPPVFMGPGDIMEATVEGIGSIQNRCARDRA